ncbi:serine/threonine-protein phosphatase 6 regulatory ankyrin repeat subunit A-like isoform X2 [Haliotis rufescens]|uniref:serine/threonine-protein phosphatase 6 regulatory ankyrin repeat subunit A-like isoform X2 n=1 Tax=Haliotis rufescens TaxID=6454 RepID=UPI00201E79EF|nr:serine/threonine-protein phosphatase 6 regulatory ankyrin repeat subunit A-like isoform X2 [Haliotis rufescens]
MMELTSVVFIILVSLCGVRDVHADTNLPAFSRKLDMPDREIKAWKGTVAYLGIEMRNNFDLLELSLKEELTNTFIPALITPLVKQAITGILKEENIGNIVRGRVLNVVKSLKVSIHKLKTQLRSVKRQFRKVKREGDSYKESLGKLRGELTKDFQGIQQRIQELEKRDALREKHIQDLTEQKQKASSDRIHRERAAQMTTVTTHASSDPSHGERAAQMTTVTTHASSDQSRTTRTPVTTTKKPATQATPSPADCEDLHNASGDGDLEEVKRVLSRGVDVNCRVGGSRTPVEFVLSLNVVDIDSRGGGSWTPVMRAAYRGHRDVVELLVNKGADVSLVDKDGDNILHLACIRGHLEIVKFVLSLNVVDINSRGGGSWTPVMRATNRGHRYVVELLVSKGADVSLVDGDGNNILHLACSQGHLETVEFVLSLNVVDINSRGGWSLTPVMRAARNGHTDVVELLVSKGADVSLVDEDGYNILHLACIEGHLETVEFVLSLNVVDIDARNNDGETAADMARSWGHTRVANLLVSRGAQ